MKQVRTSAFETNSSSSHSITLSDDTEINDFLYVSPDGVCTIFTGEYGWEIREYTDAGTKASYIATYVKNYGTDESKKKYEEMLFKVVKEVTGAKEVEIVGEKDDFYEFGHIDHESVYVPLDVLGNEETLKKFIFDKKSVLRTDNDNH